LAEVALLQDSGAGAIRAEELATEALLANPTYPSARTALGWSKFLQGDFIAAERMQREAIVADPTRAV
jgi:hypothetical protein